MLAGRTDCMTVFKDRAVDYRETSMSPTDQGSGEICREPTRRRRVRSNKSFVGHRPTEAGKRRAVLMVFAHGTLPEQLRHPRML